MMKSSLPGHVAFLSALAMSAYASPDDGFGSGPVVPGTGTKIESVGDDFENADWEWIHHWPKSSEDRNQAQNAPGGESKNGRWYEGIKRGHPDVVQRVETPIGGLPQSQGALLLRSLYTGVPNFPSHQQQQDDLIADVQYRLGGGVSTAQTPSVVVRVYLPPVDHWENRSGCQFAFRCSVETTIRRVSFARNRPEQEIYYPGFFLDFTAQEDSEWAYDSATWRIRASGDGNDLSATNVHTTGWWTLGMSFTPDGFVHYYASPGVDELTPSDHLTSQTPYGYRCERLRTFLFNVCNGDDGRTWSTEWIIDDPSVFRAQ